MTYKSGLSKEQRRAGLDLLREAGAANPEDLDGYWQYLTHPAHVRSEMEGMALIERFEALDMTDSDDPEIGQKIAALQARNYEEHPQLAALVAQVASFHLPDRAQAG